MSIKTYKIESILGGISPTYYANSPGQFKASFGIDPNVFKVGKISGAIFPIKPTEFSGAVLDGTPKWILTNPKNALIYAYCHNGDIVSYSNVLASETLVGTATSGAGNGAVYYNNYLYFATPTNVSRYGPLDNSPALVNTVWTGATLGSQTALSDTAYPATSPNHPMHVHSDDFLYFGDVLPNGQGAIHAIRTSKVTNEGDTNNGSAYNVLDLPFGYKPIAIQSLGEDLAILAVSGGSDTIIYQGESALFLWDTFSPSFYRKIPIPTSIATAMKNVNGVLHIFHGSVAISGGFKISTYSGGTQIQPLQDMPVGVPPSQGAVEVIGNRLYFAGTSVYNSATAALYARGYTDGALPSNALHCVGQISSAASGRKIEAIKAVQQSQSSMPKVIVGWGDHTNNAANNGIDFQSTTSAPGSSLTAQFDTEVFLVGEPFYIKKVRVNLGAAVGAVGFISVTAYFDDGSLSTEIGVINQANYPNSDINMVLRPNDAQGQHNFYLNFQFNGEATSTTPIVLPITIEIETKAD